MNAAVIVAAGRGTRMGANGNKVFLDVEEKPVMPTIRENDGAIESISCLYMNLKGMI